MGIFWNRTISKDVRTLLQVKYQLILILLMQLYSYLNQYYKIKSVRSKVCFCVERINSTDR